MTLYDLFGTSDEKPLRAPVVVPVEVAEPVKQLNLSERREAVLRDSNLNGFAKIKALRELRQCPPIR